jgi:dephospho-CoA kinase
MRRRPYLIGLTGNIATGKSQVARILTGQGVRVLDADRIAHAVMAPGGPAHAAVVEAFGPSIVASGGTVDRSRLGAIVFRDEAALKRLEAIVHPAVLAEVDRQLAEATEPVVVVEAIKLIEAGMHRGCDEMWVVTAPRPVQIARLVAMRGLSEEEAALRVDAQPPQQEKAALADRVIVNDGTLDELRRQVEAAWTQVQARHVFDQEPSSQPQQPEPRGSPTAGSVCVRHVRPDDLDDAAGVANVLNSVIAEGRYTGQTKIDGISHDEVLLELHFRDRRRDPSGASATGLDAPRS